MPTPPATPGAELLTYCGVTLLEHPNNKFELKYGTEPSFGVFRCNQEDWEAVTTFNSQTVDDQLFGDLVFKDGENTVTLTNMYLVRGMLDSRTGTYELVVADKRILLSTTQCLADYNTYKSQALSGDEYELDNLKPPESGSGPGTEWTYEQVINDIMTGVVGGILTLPRDVSRKPRNIRGIGRSNSEVLEQLMYELNCFLAYSAITGNFSIIPIGKLDQSELASLNGYDDRIVLDKDITGTGIWAPSTVRAYFAVIATGSYDYKDATPSVTCAGERGYITAYTDSTNGKDFAQDFATELAGDFENAAQWWDSTYAGLINIDLNSVAHIITYTSNSLGCTTRVQRVWPQAGPKPFTSNLFTANGFVSNPGVVLVTVTAISSRPGVYTGYMRVSVKQKFDPTGSLQLNANTVNEFGEQGAACYILNAAEESTATHALMEAGADTSRTHVGMVMSMLATDNKPVVVINGSTGIVGC